MKKISVIIIALLVCLCANGQSKGHMSFMGIPMGISISSFQTKLAAKGVKYDPMFRHLEDAVRLYNGKFAGYQAAIFVYYDIKSHLVYRAKVCVERGDKSLADNVFFELLEMLVKKYGYDNVYKNSSEDDTDYSISVEIDEGRIDMYEVQNNADYFEHYDDYYIVHIDYFDAAAQVQNIKNRMEDL